MPRCEGEDTLAEEDEEEEEETAEFFFDDEDVEAFEVLFGDDAGSLNASGIVPPCVLQQPPIVSSATALEEGQLQLRVCAPRSLSRRVVVGGKGNVDEKTLSRLEELKLKNTVNPPEFGQLFFNTSYKI